VYYTSVATIIISDYFKTCLYHDDPLFQAVSELAAASNLRW